MKNNMKFYTGQNIQQSSHLTDEVTLFDLYMSIVEPSKDLIKAIHQLVEVKSIGPDAYRKLKTRLPYFIGAQFRDNIRRAENFMSTSYFILDLDHCIIELEDEEKLKNKLREDKRIALMFTSPGGEGLKLVFALQNPITDTQVFSNFYTAFAGEFAKYYELEKYMDFATKDATRVCFFSVDPKAYVNEDSVAVDVEKYISRFDDSEVGDVSKESTNEQGKLTDDKYADILKKLNPKTPKKTKEYYVPEIISTLMHTLSDKAQQWGMPIVDSKDISYGKQLVFERDNIKGVVNLYHGKRGFTIVATNKVGSNEHFSQICARFIEQVVYQPLTNDIPFEPLPKENHMNAVAHIPIHQN